MSISVRDIEEKIDKEYFNDEILETNSFGIKLTDYTIPFEECAAFNQENLVLGYDEVKCVGGRNSLTDPPYMIFRVNDKDIIILFKERDSFYEYADKIRKLGFDTFDLS